VGVGRGGEVVWGAHLFRERSSAQTARVEAVESQNLDPSLDADVVQLVRHFQRQQILLNIKKIYIRKKKKSRNS
jgi:hypothetical protein